LTDVNEEVSLTAASRTLWLNNQAGPRPDSAQLFALLHAQSLNMPAIPPCLLHAAGTAAGPPPGAGNRLAGASMGV